MNDKFLRNVLCDVYTLVFVLLSIPYVGKFKILPIGIPALWLMLGVFIFLVGYRYMGRDLIIDCEKSLLIYAVYLIVILLVITAVLDIKSFALGCKMCIIFLLYIFNFYWLTPKVLNFDLAVKAYVAICVLVSMLLIIQVLSAYTGHPFVPIPRDLMVYENIEVTSNMIIDAQLSKFRFSAFFLESAHFCQYVLPGLIIALFIIERVGVAGIMSVAILASSSTLGLVLLFVIWWYYFWSKSENRQQLTINLLLFALIALIFVCVVLTNDTLWTTFMGKVNSVVDGEIVRGTSLYERMFGGWDVFREFPFLVKIFGCGYQNVAKFIVSTGYGLNIYTGHDGGIGYMGCMPQMFCELGIIGVGLYFSYLYDRIRGNFDSVVMAFSILWLLMSFAVDGFDSFTYLVPMVFTFAWIEQKKNGRLTL